MPFCFHAAAFVTGALLLESLASAQAPPEAPAAALDVTTSPVSPAPPPAPAPAPTAPTTGDLITAQVGTRVALRLQNPNAGSRNEVDDVGSDGEVDVILAGRIHPFVKWQAAFIGSYGTPVMVVGGTTARADFETKADVLDLVAKLEIADAINLWIGRMPIPSNRASLSTVWGLATWTMPGVYSHYPLSGGGGAQPWPGPRYGTNQRGDGVTFWGQLGGGRFKYYAGMFDLARPNQSPLYTGRLAVSLLNPEPGYRTSSGYYGGKNVLALGIGGQHKAGGSVSPLGAPTFASNFNQLGADVLFEINGGAAGVLDLEGEVAKMWGRHELGSYQVFVLASYLVPIDIGIGRIQPLVRYQHAGGGDVANATGAFTSLDAQLGYIIDGYNARLLAVYQYAKLQNREENALLFGLQLLTHGK